MAAPELKLSRDLLDDLMVRYQQADKEAAATLIDIVSPILFRFFCHHTGNRDDACDLLQESWLRIHKSRNSYLVGQPVLPWLFGIARHVKVDEFRRKQRTNSREKTMDLIPEIVSSDIPKTSSRSFEDLVNPLPDNQREVVTMLKVTGMSLEEIAAVTGCTVGSVKQKAHRAYETLRKLLRSPHPNGGPI